MWRAFPAKLAAGTTGPRLSSTCPPQRRRVDAAETPSQGVRLFFKYFQPSARSGVLCLAPKHVGRRGSDVETQHLPPAHGGVLAVSRAMGAPILGPALTPELDGREALLRHIMLAAIALRRDLAIAVCSNVRLAGE